MALETPPSPPNQKESTQQHDNAHQKDNDACPNRN
jgi:hypothetical protein